jgi:hypothetical protein
MLGQGIKVLSDHRTPDIQDAGFVLPIQSTDRRRADKHAGGNKKPCLFAVGSNTQEPARLLAGEL